MDSLEGDSQNIVELPPFSIRGYWLSIGVIVATAAYLGARWHDIPLRFATHFDGGWKPDAWAGKTGFNVFALSLTNLALLVLLAGLMLSFTKYKIYARVDRSEAGKKATGAAISASVTAMGWFTFALTTCLSALQLSMVLPAGQSLTSGIGILIGVVSLVGAVALVVYIMSKTDKARGGSTRRVSYLVDEQYYKGGMFYHNPDDPARVVDKRDGVGVDFNYAHAPGKIFAASIAILLLAPVLLVFL